MSRTRSNQTGAPQARPEATNASSAVAVDSGAPGVAQAGAAGRPGARAGVLGVRRLVGATDSAPKRRRTSGAARKCGHCKQPGHNRRSCPSLQADATRRASSASSSSSSTAVRQHDDAVVVASVPAAESRRRVSQKKLVYFVFDLETSGFRGAGGGEIVQIAISALNHSGATIPGATFESFVKPSRPISAGVSADVHGITDADVAGADGFDVVGKNAMQFIAERIGDGEIGVLVAYNGNSFDFPFLAQELAQHGLLLPQQVRYTIDPLAIVRHWCADVAPLMGVRVPSDTKLSTVYKYFTHADLLDAHDALADTRALGAVLRADAIWKLRLLHRFLRPVADSIDAAVRPQHVDEEVEDEMIDDDDDDGGDGLDMSWFDANGEVLEHTDYQQAMDDDSGDEPEPEHDTPNEPDGWDVGVGWDGLDTKESFDDAFARPSTRSQRRQNSAGLQLHPDSVNTPMKAFNKIFYGKVADLIVKYTNQYGRAHDDDRGRWRDIDKKELYTWLGVLSLAALRRRRDAPGYWFSDHPLYSLPVAKRAMSGRRFLQILRALHVCDLERQPRRGTPEYTPEYKIAEFFDTLLGRCRELFEPGQQLSLDESLVRAFGRISFKVRVVTKSARYGIKVYVLTDAKTSYVVDAQMYAGQHHRHADGLESFGKTAQVVLSMVDRYRDTHRTVYTDRYYTSIELAQEMLRRGLYLTGTIDGRRLKCAAARLTKKDGTRRGRGYIKRSTLTFTDAESQEQHKFGVVAWMDSKPVHLLTSEGSTNAAATCRRRCKTAPGGVIEINRPTLVAEYNKYMGGVDAADARRLHLETRVHGLRRWWIRLFFYGFDVALGNALVLYRESFAEGDKRRDMNLRQFREALVKEWLKDALVPRAPTEVRQLQHIRVPLGGQMRCAVCAYWVSLNKREKSNIRSGCTSSTGEPWRTTYKCEACDIPVCGPKHRDCFKLLHESKSATELYVREAAVRRAKTNCTAHR